MADISSHECTGIQTWFINNIPVGFSVLMQFMVCNVMISLIVIV